MDSDASDNYEYLYEENDAPKHNKLVEKVLSLNKTQHLKKPSRTEPSLQISEFNLVKSITGDKGSIEINDLTKVLKNRTSRVKISEKVKKLKNSHTLPKPLEKPQAERIRRSVAYEKARLQLDKWEAVVTANRVSTDLSFPLDNDLKLDKKEATKFPQMWRVKSKLEQELEKAEPKVEKYHVDLEKEKFPLTLKEMLARRKEAAKLRAFQGYKEAKARRQNKIKSKKYHRIQKREKIKQKLKEFEQLQKVDPELALKKLEEIEKSRAEERFSLRHKSTGKWARSKQIRAKYDKESRQVLAEQLTISRELTQKLKPNDSESEDEEIETNQPIENDENNPWVNGVKPDKEIVDFISDYRKYWTEKNKSEQTEEKKEDEKQIPEVENNVIVNNQEKLEKVQKKQKRRNIKDQSINNENISKAVAKKQPKKVKTKSTSQWEVHLSIDNLFYKAENKIEKKMKRKAKKIQQRLDTKTPKRNISKEKDAHQEKPKKVDLSLPSQVKRPVIDEELITSEDTEINKDLNTLKSILTSETKEKESDVDPNKYLQVKTTNLSTAIPDTLAMEENEENVNQREIISEAFEDDDIVQEFNKEKQDEIDKDKPKDINLSLPGWGSWGGANIKVSKRKRRLFTVKMPEKIPRRDDNKGSLIINESAQKKIKEHMVSEIPFPFKTVKDFEASIRAPIGNTFVPETAYRKLIKPAVTTKMGAIIEPLSKDILFNKNG